jgi:predicted transcriptional regulator
MEGFINLHRKIQYSWLWSKPEYFQWFTAMLFKANYKNIKAVFEGNLKEIERGSFITSIRKLSAELPQCSEQKLRTFLRILEKDKIIKITNPSKKATQITIINYDSYQYDQQGDNTKKTHEQHADNTQATQPDDKNQHNENTVKQQKSTQKKSFETSDKQVSSEDCSFKIDTSVTHEFSESDTRATQTKIDAENYFSENQRQVNKRKKEKRNKKNVSNSEKENFPESPPPQILNLFDSIKNYFPERIISRLTPEKEKAWTGTLEKLIRIDGYSPAEIETIIRLARSDPFWKENFLSMTKLRRSDKDGVKYIDRFSLLKERAHGRLNDSKRNFKHDKNRMKWE